MNLGEKLGKIRNFVMRAVGALPGGAGDRESIPARLIRVGHLLFRGYVDDDLTIHASSLTFVTLTSLVPILAVGFALIKGFGMGPEQMASISQMDWFLEMPSQWQQFAQQVLSIVSTTNFAALGWIGLVFFVLTAVLVLANVEKSFNRVWGVGKSRSLLRQITNYTSVLVLMPLLIGLVGWLKAQIAISRKIFDIDANVWAQDLAAFVIMWLAVGFLYVFVPNTRVRLRSAFFSSLFTTLVFIGWMRMFTVMQTGVVNYDRIYGAFAAVPVFLFWMYVTWVILLLGAEFTFALQNSDTYQLESSADSASARARILVALMLLRRAGMAMKTGESLDPAAFARNHKAPIRLINSVVAALVRQKYLGQIAPPEVGYLLKRLPETIRLSDLVAELLHEGGGHEELESNLTMDEPLTETLGKIEEGLARGFGGMTLADMVLAAPAEKKA